MVYFIPKKGARLGNWLFQYAVAASIGDGGVATLDTPYSRKAIERYSDFLAGIKIVSELPKDAVMFREDRRRYIAPPKCGRRAMVLDGYFQQVAYLKKERFVAAFDIPERKRKRYELEFGNWLSRPDVTAIHVRRGDYLRLSHCHPFVGERYFINCLEYLPEVRDFLVFSDDIAWCKTFFRGTFPDRRFRFVEGMDLLDDFHLQSLCQNNIISNSSFSWWAAYLNRNPSKRILAPDKWFGFYLCAQGINGDGMYFPGIEKVPVEYPLKLKAKAVLDMMREVPLNMAAAVYHVFIPR